jgi:Xaa-Pro dipeptidase
MNATPRLDLSPLGDAERPAHRLERLGAWMEEQAVDALVACGARAATYLAGYSRYYGGPVAVVVDRSGERTLVVMRDEVPVAERLGQADTVLGFGVRGFGLELDPIPLLVDVVGSVPAVARASRLGVVDEYGRLEELLRAPGERVPAADVLARLQLLKDDDELEKIVHAYELSWLGQKAVAEAAGRGASEIEMFSAAQSAAQIAHGEPIEFLADLLSGPDTAEVCCPIRIASPRTVKPGEPVVADVVVGANGYWGDTAETHLTGENAEVAEAREVLLGILEQARTELRPGVTGAEIFRAMDERIMRAFPKGEFPHHGGHALGLTSFEDPHLIPTDERPLESSMVIAVEPGVYLSGRFGARVENVFVVTPAGGVELRELVGGRDA